jgi:hypothetical protein
MNIAADVIRTDEYGSRCKEGQMNIAADVKDR